MEEQITNFTEEWDKLKDIKVGKQITTIRWNDYPETTIGRVIPIKLNGTEIAKGKIIAIEFLRMNQLTFGFIRKDSHKSMTFERFFAFMKGWYERKANWAGWMSNVNVYYIEITEVLKHG